MTKSPAKLELDIQILDSFNAKPDENNIFNTKLYLQRLKYFSVLSYDIFMITLDVMYQQIMETFYFRDSVARLKFMVSTNFSQKEHPSTSTTFLNDILTCMKYNIYGRSKLSL